MPDQPATPTPSPTPSPSTTTNPTSKSPLPAPKALSGPAREAADDAWAKAFDSFHQEFGEPTIPPQHPETDLAPVDPAPEPEPEPPTEPAEPEPAPEPTETEPEKPDSTPAQPPAPSIPDGLDDKDRSFLKQMSKYAREHFTQRVTALQAEIADRDAKLADAQKQVEVNSGKRLPDAWYEQPNAYVVSPEYQEAEKNFNAAQDATRAWAAQLDALDDGKDFYVPGQQGAVLVKAADVENPNRYRRVIEDARFQAYEEQKKWAAQGERISNEFAATQQRGEKNILNWINENLPWFKDDKSKEQQGFKQVSETIAKLRGTRSISADAKLAAALGVQLLKERALHVQEKQKWENTQKTELARRRAGPNPRPGGAGNATVGDKKFTLADF